jgi:hypothetical protein
MWRRLQQSAGKGGRLVVTAENHSITGGCEAVGAALMRARASMCHSARLLPDAFWTRRFCRPLHDQYGIMVDAVTTSGNFGRKGNDIETLDGKTAIITGAAGPAWSGQSGGTFSGSARMLGVAILILMWMPQAAADPPGEGHVGPRLRRHR